MFDGALSSPVPADDRVPRRVVQIAVAILASLVIGLSAQAADAAPPEVKASENPVVILYGQTTKAITLTATITPATQIASLVVKEGATTILTQYVMSPPGTASVPLTVNYGQSYTARLYDLNNAPLGAPLVITTRRPLVDLQIDGCAIKVCITSHTVAPYFSGAKVAVDTSIAAKTELHLSKSGPVNAQLSNVEKSISSGILDTDWSTIVFSLSPATKYYYLIKATDAGGLTDQKTGSFTTLQRQINVIISSITVVNDSDPITSGEFYFQLSLDGQDSAIYANGDITDGQTVYPALSKTIIKNSGSTVALTLLGVDNDFGVCYSAINGGNIKNCGEWASAEKTLDVTKAGGAISLSANANSVHFTAVGAYVVTYV